MAITAPTDIANCQAWLDAEDASTLDAPEGLTYSWDNKGSSNGALAPQTGKPLQIVDYNGKRALQVIGTGGYVSWDELATYFTGDFTAFFVGTWRATSSNAFGWGAGSSASNTPTIGVLSSNSKYVFQLRNDANGLTSVTSSANADTVVDVFTVRKSGSNLAFWKHKTSLGTGTRSGAFTLNQFAFGSSPRTTQQFTGPALILGWVLYSDDLNDTQVGDVQDYLIARHVPGVTNDYGYPTNWPLDKRTLRFRATRVAGSGSYGRVYDLGRNRFDGSTGHYYVSRNGSDSNSGTSGSPYRSITKALEQLDVCAVECLDAGPFAWSNSYTRPERSVCLFGANPFIVSNFEADDSWSLTSGQSNTYEITRTTSTTRVVDITNVDSDGKPTALTPRASIALVEANPGSYFSDSGTSKVYVHTWDSRTPDDKVCVQIGTWTPRWPFSGAGRFLHVENMVTIGHTGVFNIDVSGCYYDYLNCQHFYGAEWSHQNAAEVNRQNCTSTGNSGDGFDYRASTIAVEDGCYVGANGTTDTDNCSTAHNSAVVVRFGNEYFSAPRPVHDIETTRTWTVDCLIRDAIDNGGSSNTGDGIIDGGFGATEGANTTIENCQFENIPGSDVVANGGCTATTKWMRSGDFTREVNGSPVGVINVTDEPLGDLVGAGSLQGQKLNRASLVG